MDTKITVNRIPSGEFAAMGAAEILSVPSMIALQERYPAGTDIEAEYRLGFSNLLTEIYQGYRSVSAQNPNAEMSAEILWVTEPVANQTFRAKIRLFLVLRAIGASQEAASSMVQRMQNACDSMLRMYQYASGDLGAEGVAAATQQISLESIRVLVKDERIDPLNTEMLPNCYGFDRFDAVARDLGNVVNSLIDHPNCALSVQLMPTRFSPQENAAVAQITPILDTLSHGIMTQGVGNVAFSGAERLAETYRYYQSSRNNALFGYNFVIYGDRAAAEDLSSKLYGFLTYDTSRQTAIRQVYFQEASLGVRQNLAVLPWVVNELLVQTDRNPYVLNPNYGFAAFSRLPFVITAEEASGLFRLPIGNQRIAAGLPVNETESTSKTYANNLINAGDIEIGKMKSSGGRNSIGISLNDLAKHMLVVGTPGSGKTTFSVSLLDRLWKDHHIPFLVIEPAKNEYRALVQSIPELQVFTPGKNFISPFVFNPFVPPKNVKLETYKSTLKTAFAAAVTMTSPLDKIFEESINNCYSDFRWLDTYTSDGPGRVFNIADFIKCFQNTFDQIGYTGDARNIGRAGVVRLNGLANLFDNYHSIPIEDLLSKPTIIELAAIENSDEKALIISLLLLSILAYVNSNYVGEGGLKNVILLEEAHVLLDADTSAGAGEANPSAIAQNLVKRMLAEIRSYGVGLVIADQSPRKVGTDVVALTDMKMVFRLVEATDKQIVADSMNMSEAQIQRMSRLKPGEAFLFFNRLDEPEEVQTPNYRLENNISITLSDEGIRSLTTYWNDRQDKLRPYPECALTPYCDHTCDYYRRVLAREVARRLFVKYLRPDLKDYTALKELLAQISTRIQEELNDEEFTPELRSCVKVHLWRRIKYNSQIPVKDHHIEGSLRRP
ncbi:MAG: ATP-binding protein [Lachnospiraceae bacterium]|nr:ATP-binding protein [Lachnospiraceae bacterium]